MVDPIAELRRRRDERAAAAEAAYFSVLDLIARGEPVDLDEVERVLDAFGLDVEDLAADRSRLLRMRDEWLAARATETTPRED
jgi:hypothetical protein